MKDNTMGSWADDMPALPDEQENPDNWKFLVLVAGIIVIALITKKSHANQGLQGDNKEKTVYRTVCGSYSISEGV